MDAQVGQIPSGFVGRTSPPGQEQCLGSAVKIRPAAVNGCMRRNPSRLVQRHQPLVLVEHVRVGQLDRPVGLR
ncbi:MAG: hypothetical protein QOJ19_4410 [Acidimicrobiia bacterium]|nr:hypothetical protein [Acidimicrobiia bacterium]